MKKIELLAPAGDLERLKMAIRYGADAVYLGGKRFSLRSRASNFEIEDIAEGVRFANSYGAAVHVTVNMIPHSDDFEGLEEYLKQLEQIGVRAIIVASATIIQIAKSVAPKLEVHLSTQMSSTNSLAVKYFQQLGADRVVLARECSMQQIRSICQHSDCPIETFIHGGMCVNYSGRCTLSNAMTLRDANRGGCAQSCRWKYHVVQQDQLWSDENNLFSMSSKDLMAARYVKEMMEAGVTSLKIEGRMKSAYYIATVVHAYRQLIDQIQKDSTCVDEMQIQQTIKELGRAENRPTCEGFLPDIPTSHDHLYGVNGAGVTHDFLAMVLDYDATQHRVKLEVRNKFALHEEVEIVGPGREVQLISIEELQDESGQFVYLANKPMQILWAKVAIELKPYDIVRKKEKLDA